jgi:hypothetical protein
MDSALNHVCDSPAATPVGGGGSAAWARTSVRVVIPGASRNRAAGHAPDSRPHIAPPLTILEKRGVTVVTPVRRLHRRGEIDAENRKKDQQSNSESYVHPPSHNSSPFTCEHSTLFRHPAPEWREVTWMITALWGQRQGLTPRQTARFVRQQVPDSSRNRLWVGGLGSN